MFGPAAIAPSGNSWEMQILGVYLRPTGSETLGWGPKFCVWPSPPGDSAAHSSLRNRESNALFILVIFQIGNSDVDCWSPSGNPGDIATGFLKECTGTVLFCLVHCLRLALWRITANLAACVHDHSLSRSSVGQKSGQAWMRSPLNLSHMWCQPGWAPMYKLWEESAAMLIQAVGKIQVFAAVGLGSCFLAVAG